MHTISTEPDGDGYRARCSCGWSSNRYGSSDAARFVGYTHKAQAEGNPTDNGNSNDDPRTGW